MNPLFTNSTTNPQGVTVIHNAAVHYAPYACQYTKRGDIQTDIASGVTCHHCKARLGQEPHSDNPVWRGILAGTEWPSAIEAEPPAPYNPFKNVFEKIVHDESVGYELKDIPRRLAEQAKAQPQSASTPVSQALPDEDAGGESGEDEYIVYIEGVKPRQNLREVKPRTPGAWFNVSQALPDDGVLVLVKLAGTEEPALARCYRNDRNNWFVQPVGSGTYWTRSMVEGWKRI